MDTGREQNYWPAFVDALSNVVLTLIFVIVIFVFALVMATNKAEDQIKKMMQVETTDKTQENQDLKQQVATLSAEIVKMQQTASEQNKAGAKDVKAISTLNQDTQIMVEKKEEDKTNQGPVQVDHAVSSVTLGFPLSVVEMDQKSADQLGHVLDAIEKTVGKHKILMRSIIGKETYSAAQRLAYYRAIGARNYLITKMGESPNNISISIVQPPQPEDGRVEIIFQKD
jgi:cell division protein FtsB